MTNDATVSINGDSYHLTTAGWHGPHGAAVTLTDVLQTATTAGDHNAADTALRLHREHTARAITDRHPRAAALFSDYARASDLLDVATAAALVGIGAPTLRKYNAARPGPPYLPPPTLILGGSPLWARHTLQTWLASRPGRGRRGQHSR